MLVARKGTADPSVVEAGGARFLVASELDRRLWRLQRSPVATWRSPARFGTLSAQRINEMPVDIVNLHWVTDGFLSIEAIGRISKPIVWSMYDMWPFTGTEHYVDDTPQARWRSGYTRANRPPGESGIDLDRWAYERKVRHWCRPMHMVPASGWLAESTASSRLMNGWRVTRIPHVIDTERFAPADMRTAREALGLPTERPLVLFLASAGITDGRKGWDLLEPAIHRIRRDRPDLEVVVAGPASPEHTPFPIHWMGPVSDPAVISTLYAACTVTAVPSREDNLPLTALEAHACGRPVVAFRIGGLPDIVDHLASGYLAAPFDSAELASGIGRAINDSQSGGSWGAAARKRAVSGWSPQAVVRAYLDVYAEVLA